MTIDQGPIDPEIVELFLEDVGGTVSAISPVSNTAVIVEFEKEEGALWHLSEIVTQSTNAKLLWLLFTLLVYRCPSYQNLMGNCIAPTHNCVCTCVCNCLLSPTNILCDKGNCL